MLRFLWTHRHRSLGISISMTGNGEPKDNTVAECVNNRLKNELLKDMEVTAVGEVKRQCLLL